MNKQTYLDHFQDRYGMTADGSITDFLSRRGEHLLLGDRIDLNALVARYGAPLEVAYCPLITKQIEQMQSWVSQAIQRSNYSAGFIYAYATKANFAEEVIRTALASGAHHETSAAADVVIAHQLWRQGILPTERYIFCNGSKDRTYIDAIIALRRAGFENLVPILDSIEELETLLAGSDEAWMFGVRSRFAPELVDHSHPGGERFGMTQAEIATIAECLAGSKHRLVLYHAMVGSQIEDAEAWEARLRRSAVEYSDLAKLAPTLHMFNFGGGMPTSAYDINFSFDYAGFLERLMLGTAQICAEQGVAAPTIVGEFGRYTVASHSVFLMEVGSLKASQAPNEPDWFLLNGSLMVTLPDILIVEGQQFVVLPLDGWERPITETRLGGRYTCDTDDFFPRGGQPALVLPEYSEEQPTIVAFFGIGAYQQMISGRGGAHHCLTPEMRRIIIEQDDDALVVREVAPQSLTAIMSMLGYPQGEVLEPVSIPMRRQQREFVPQQRTQSTTSDRRPIRESVLAVRTPRRRQPTFPYRPVAPRDPRS